MKKLNTIILILLGMICTQLYAVQLNSIYPLKPNDSEAFYFTPENYPIRRMERWMYRMLCRQRLIK